MHELGHNIFGDGSNNAPYSNHRDGQGHTNKKCAMNEDRWDTFYCSETWNDLNLAYCHSNYNGNM